MPVSKKTKQIKLSASPNILFIKTLLMMSPSCLLFSHKSQKNVASVVRELKVLPSKRVYSMEVYSQNDENLVLRNKEKIEWLAGGLLENLFYRLYDEAGREVPLAAEIASKVKVRLDYKMHACSILSYYADAGFVNVRAIYFVFIWEDSSGSAMRALRCNKSFSWESLHVNSSSLIADCSL